MTNLFNSGVLTREFLCVELMSTVNYLNLLGFMNISRNFNTLTIASEGHDF